MGNFVTGTHNIYYETNSFSNENECEIFFQIDYIRVFYTIIALIPKSIYCSNELTIDDTELTINQNLNYSLV